MYNVNIVAMHATFPVFPSLYALILLTLNSENDWIMWEFSKEIDS